MAKKQTGYQPTPDSSIDPLRPPNRGSSVIVPQRSFPLLQQNDGSIIVGGGEPVDSAIEQSFRNLEKKLTDYKNFLNETVQCFADYFKQLNEQLKELQEKINNV